HRPPYPLTRHARGRPPGTRPTTPGPPLAARARAVRGTLGAPRWLPRARRNARAFDQATPRREGGRARARAPRAARDTQRSEARPTGVAARDRVSRARAERRRPGDSRRYGVAPRRPSSAR